MRWSISADLTAAGPREGAFDRVAPQFEVHADSQDEAIKVATAVVNFALPDNWVVIASSLSAVPVSEYAAEYGDRLVREGSYALTYALLRGITARNAREFARWAGLHYPNLSVANAYSIWAEQE